MQMPGWTVSEFTQIGIGSQWQSNSGIALSGQRQYTANMVWMIVSADYQLDLFMMPVHDFFQVTQYILLATKMYINGKQAIVVLHNETVRVATLNCVYLHRINQVWRCDNDLSQDQA